MKWLRRTMRPLAVVTVVVLASSFDPSEIHADEAQPNVAKAEVSLHGVWQIVAFKHDGKVLPKESLKEMTIVIDRQALAIRAGGIETLRLNYTARTKKSKTGIEGTIDTTHELSPGKPIQQLGILAIEKGRLRIGLSVAGSDRPADFDAVTGSSLTLVRVKDAKLGKLLRGTWRVVGFRSDGSNVPKERLTNMRVVIGETIFQIRNADALVLGVNYTAQVETTNKSSWQGHFDTEHELDRGKPIVQLGRFSLENGQLRIAITVAGGDRPGDFESKVGSVFTLVK